MQTETTPLHHKVTGLGDPVVFLHGFMEDTSIWKNITDHFADKTCIAIDLHGHGASFFDQDAVPSIALMAEQVRTLLDTLEIGNYQLVGHSLGGYVGCELLKSDPELEQLVLFHSHPFPDNAAKKKDRDRVIELVKTRAKFFISEAIPGLFAFPEEHEEAIKTYSRIAEKMRPEAIGWSAAAMRDRPSYVNILSEKSGQVSVIQGELDKVVPGKELRDFVEKQQIHWFGIERCGHMSQEEAPEKAVELLKAILG